MQEAWTQLPQLIAAAASDKKAADIVILDMKNVLPVTDYFVICSANTPVQAKAIADNIEEKLGLAGVNPLRREGYREARWILLDYGTCVVHVFVESERRYYSLERLWGDAQAYRFEA